MKQYLIKTVTAVCAALLFTGCGDGGVCATLALPGCGDGGGSSDTGASTQKTTLQATVRMQVGATVGPFTVDVPEGAVSLTIVADGGGTSDMDISSITDPDGWRLITDGINDPIGRNTAQGYGQSVVAMTIPHSEDYSFKPGQWSFSITHYASPDGDGRDVSVYAYVKEKIGRTLDVNVWLVDIPDYAGPNDANLKGMMDEFARLMGTAGISIGAVSVRELHGEAAARLTYIDSETDADSNGQPDDMDELFRMSAQADNDYLNLFFVRDIGVSILGIAGGIPGPPLLQGTAHSGVVISTFGGLTQMTQADLLLQGATIAHEVGHYIGLFHTTERSGATFDPISDTPECDAAVYDTNHDGVVSAAECRNLDGPNLMFWSAASYVQEYLSPMQDYVMRVNPAVK